MTKARFIANLASDGSALSDGTINYTDITGTPAPFDPATLAAVAVSGSFNDLSNQPAAFDPNTLAPVAVSGAYADVTGTPTLAAVAGTGAYADLSGTPAPAGVVIGTASGSIAAGDPVIINTNSTLSKVTLTEAPTSVPTTTYGSLGGSSYHGFAPVEGTRFILHAYVNNGTATLYVDCLRVNDDGTFTSISSYNTNGGSYYNAAIVWYDPQLPTYITIIGSNTTKCVTLNFNPSTGVIGSLISVQNIGGNMQEGGLTWHPYNQTALFYGYDATAAQYGIWSFWATAAGGTYRLFTAINIGFNQVRVCPDYGSNYALTAIHQSGTLTARTVTTDKVGLTLSVSPEYTTSTGNANCTINIVNIGPSTFMLSYTSNNWMYYKILSINGMNAPTQIATGQIPNFTGNTTDIKPIMIGNYTEANGDRYTIIFNDGSPSKMYTISQDGSSVVLLSSGANPGLGAVGSLTWLTQNFYCDVAKMYIAPVRLQDGYVFTSLASGITSNLNAPQQFLGLSSGTYADGETATINTVGSVNTHQTGLTAGTVYYINDATTLVDTTGTYSVGVALNSTDIIVAGGGV